MNKILKYPLKMQTLPFPHKLFFRPQSSSVLSRWIESDLDDKVQYNNWHGRFVCVLCMSRQLDIFSGNYGTKLLWNNSERMFVSSLKLSQSLEKFRLEILLDYPFTFLTRSLRQRRRQEVMVWQPGCVCIQMSNVEVVKRKRARGEGKGEDWEIIKSLSSWDIPVPESVREINNLRDNSELVVASLSIK